MGLDRLAGKLVHAEVGAKAGDRKDPWGNMKTGTRATATINRQDFGVKWNTAIDGGGYIVGDEVAIELDVELARRK